MAITTSKYRSDNAKRFVEDVIANDYYIFASSLERLSLNNSEYSKQEFLEKTIFGKKVLDENVFYMIRNYPWQTGEVFDQYDDSQDMVGKKYYAVVYPTNNETEDYRIYKCIFNNYGAAATTPPNYNASTPNQIYDMPDGYKWKFMYALSEVQFEQFNARGYIPIVGANTSVSATSAEIDEIVIDNPTVNSGYEEVRGSIAKVNTISAGGGSLQITDIDLDAVTDFPLNQIENYYENNVFYVYSGTQSEIYEIAEYSYNPTTGKGNVVLVGNLLTSGNPLLSQNRSYKILPKLTIRGDGSGAEAIPVLTNGSVTSVQFLNKGTGYTKATAEIVDPRYYDPLSLNSLDIRAVLRVIISPKGGHAANLIDELGCRHVLVHAGITDIDNNSLPTTNTFASVGLVKDPSFRVSPAPTVFDNRFIVSLDTLDLSVGDTLIQVETADESSEFYDKRIFEGVIHEIGANNTVYLTDYMGSFPPSTESSINDTSFRPDLPLRSTENKIYTINTDNDPLYPSGLPGGFAGYDAPDYEQRTGEVYFMDDFIPVERNENANEQFKIIFEF